MEILAVQLYLLDCIVESGKLFWRFDELCGQLHIQDKSLQVLSNLFAQMSAYLLVHKAHLLLWSSIGRLFVSELASTSTNMSAS